MTGRGPRALLAVGAALVALFTVAFGVGAALGLEDEATWSGWLSAGEGRGAAAALVVGALTVDLALPVPSSLVMTWSGRALGTAGGAAASAVGSLLGSALGFAACRVLGRPAFARLVGEEELPALRASFDRWGSWLVLLSRPVPMLTETVACLAGLSGMSAARYLGLSAAGTLPLCLLYAWVGARAEGPGEVGAALLVALGIPAIGFGVARARGLA